MQSKLITAALAAVALTVAGCAEGYDGYGRYDGYNGRGYDPYASQYVGGCYPGERYDDCRERLRYQQEHQSQYVWRDGQYYREDGRSDAAGAAIAGGIIGFILGAVVAGSKDDRDYAERHKGDRGWRDRCAATYPGFDPNTGTYPSPDGVRRYCTR